MQPQGLSITCARRALLVLLATAVGAAPATAAVNYYLAVDVPSKLGGSDYTTNQIVRSDSAVYVLEQALPANAELASLHRRADGVWLFSPAHPLTLGATTYEPRDIVSFDGAVFAMILDGSAIGIPDDARIDSLFQHPSGGVVLSFDVPVNLAGTDYARSDLVRYNGGFSLYFAGAAAGVPASSNIVGAAVDNTGLLVVTFDVPTRIGASDFLPGQLVQWNGVSFTSYFIDAAWPISSQLRDFGFVAGAGTVPDGNTAPEVPLDVTHAPAAQIKLTWGASCLSSDNDYEIYEGVIGAYYSHASKFCTTAGALTKTFLPAAADSYYLVVPRNLLREGSYGRRSNGLERPAGLAACIPQLIDTTCHE